jgi:hypothetical protein
MTGIISRARVWTEEATVTGQHWPYCARSPQAE